MFAGQPIPRNHGNYNEKREKSQQREQKSIVLRWLGMAGTVHMYV